MVCNGAHRPANSGGYCAAKPPLGMELLQLMVPKDPLKQSMGRVLLKTGHAPFLIGSNTAVMVDII